jgi:subtilisin family serine protease
MVQAPAASPVSSRFGILCLVAILLIPTVLRSRVRRNDDPAEYRDGIILVGFEPNVPVERQGLIVASVGAIESHTIGQGTHVLHVAPGRVDVTIKALQQFKEVRYAEPDYVQHPNGVPNDPSFPLQWGFQNTGNVVNGVRGTTGADERAVAAWGVTTGSKSVVVAVVDTGISYNHPDLAANVWSNPGGINGCPAGTHGYNVLTATCDPLDDDTAYGGHGSHVAGIIGAVSNNGAGIAGVNWQTNILAVKWVSFNNDGNTSGLITALQWVINAKKAGINIRVVNDSATWPGTAFSQALSDELDALGTNDILFVTAAGNTAQNNDTVPRYPCSYARANMICAAASDQSDHLWSSSNYGISTVDLAAPGVNIYSTLKGAGTYGYISGTSMSAAQVSGAAALVLSQGYKSVADLKTIIVNAVDPLPAFTSVTRTGGRLNICKAIAGCSANAPANTAAPVISGVARAGNSLSVSNGSWTNSPTSYSYQWQRCNSSGGGCAAISGATASGYGVATADVGFTLRCAVTARNSAGSASASSAPTALVTGPVTIGTTALPNGVVGSAYTATLSASGGSTPYSWSISSGSLPAGVSLSATTGVISGTPTTTGTSTFTAKVTDASAQTASSSLSIAVATAAPPITLVQSAQVQGSAVTSVQQSFPSGNLAGNMIIAFVRMSTASQTVGVSDTAGNAYAEAVMQAQTSDGHQVHIFYAKNIRGGANTVKATISSTNNHPWLAIFEYSGLSTTAPLDRTAHAQGFGSAANTGLTPVTTSANELVFAGLGMVTPNTIAVTAGSGFSIVQQDAYPNTSRAAVETRGTTAAGQYAGTFTLNGSTDWSAVVATFKR